MASPLRVGIISAGSLGIAIAKRLTIFYEDHEILIDIWGRDEVSIRHMKVHQRHNRYLKWCTLPKSVLPTSDLRKAVTEKDFLVFALPCSGLLEMLPKVKRYLSEETINVSWVKGLAQEENKWLRPSELIFKFLPRNEVAFPLGPGFAVDIAKGHPIALGCVGNSDYSKKVVQELLEKINFRIYPSSDIIGYEIGCCLKNVLAIAVSMAREMYGDSSAASLSGRGAAEIERIALRFGAKKETFQCNPGAQVLPDYELTSNSITSRNYQAGKMIGRMRSKIVSTTYLKSILETIGESVEGVTTAKAIVEMVPDCDEIAPITYATAKILAGELSPYQATHILMTRGR